MIKGYVQHTDLNLMYVYRVIDVDVCVYSSLLLAIPTYLISINMSMLLMLPS